MRNKRSQLVFVLIMIVMLALAAMPVTPARAAAKTASVSGNWSSTATWGGTAVPEAGDTCTINAGVAVTVDTAAVCGSLTLAGGSGSPTAVTISGSNSLTISGAIIINRPGIGGSSYVDVAAGTLSGGSVTLTGTGGGRTTQIRMTTGTATISGDITAAAGDSGVIFSGAGTLNVGGNFMAGAAGTFTPGTGTVNYNGVGAQIVGAYTYSNLAASDTGTRTLEGNVTVGGDLSINGGALNLLTFTANRSTAGGTLAVSNGATLQVGGANNFPANYSAVSLGATSTVEYNGAVAQAVSARAYGNLIFSGAGAKTVATGTSVNGNLSIAPSGSATASIGDALNISVGSLTLGGLGRINGTWGSTTSTATYQNDTYFAATTGMLNVSTDTRATPSVTAWPTASGITYGQSLSASTLSGGTASVAGSFAFAAPGIIPNAGTYNASVAFTPTDLTSYKAVVGNANVAVDQVPLTVTAKDDGKTYDGVAYTGGNGLTYAGFVNDEDETFLGGTLTYGGTSQGAINVGSYVIAPGGLTSNNYAITFANGTLTITAKPITVTADSGQSKVYGAADPVFTYTSSDPAVTFTGTLSRVAGENVGTYAITQGALSAGDNYAITFVSADFTITAKPITVTADSGQSKVYGTPDPVFTYTSSDPAATFTGALSRVLGENAGTYAITQGALSAGDNYAITFVSADFTITPTSTTTSLASSANPSVVGTNVTFTAEVLPSAATGTVQFYADGVALDIPAPLLGGTANVSTTTLTVGTHVITATYSGDVNYTPSTGMLSPDQVVNAACTAVSSADFIFAPAVPRIGQSANFTATATGGTAPITYTWNFGHGAPEATTAADIAHSFPLTTTVRTYDVALSATNACTTSPAAATKQVTVVPYRIYLPLTMR